MAASNPKKAFWRLWQQAGDKYGTHESEIGLPAKRPAVPHLGQAERPAVPHLGLAERPAVSHLGPAERPAVPHLGPAERPAVPHLCPRGYRARATVRPTFGGEVRFVF